jgi:hypothetical protein
MSQLTNEAINSTSVTVTAATATMAVNVASYLGIITEWASLISICIGIVACTALTVVHCLKAHILWRKIKSEKFDDE